MSSEEESSESLASSDSITSDTTRAARDSLLGYFAGRENTFKFDRYISSGMVAHAWIVQHRRQTDEQWTKMVLKTPSADRFESSYGAAGQFADERQLLDSIRSRHIMKLIQFSDGEDPLLQDEPRNALGQWIYLEYIANGTLGNFMEKCRDEEYVPNRLLWRIFMCLIRACVAMSYIPDGPPVDRYDQNEEPCELTDSNVGYSHDDLHCDNIMVGDMLSNPDDVEHAICPIFKFIDLDSQTRRPGGEGRAVQNNLFKIGENMTAVIRCNNALHPQMIENKEDENYNISDEEADDKRYNFGWYQPEGGARFKTAAGHLLPPRVDPPAPTPPYPCPELDPDLRRLICWCTAVARADRPRLADQLLPEVKRALLERDAAYYERADYCDGAKETDDAILSFLERVLGIAPAPAPTPVVNSPGAGVSTPPLGEDFSTPVMGGDFSSPPIGTPSGTPGMGRFTGRDRREASPTRLLVENRGRYRQRDDDNTQPDDDGDASQS